MYHLLKSNQKPRLSLDRPFHLAKKRQLAAELAPTEEAPERRERLIVSTQEVGEASQEPESGTAAYQAAADEELVYTIIGEPVFPKGETTTITIVVNTLPIPFGHQNEEEANQEGDGHAQSRCRLAPVGWTLIGVLIALAGLLVAILVLPWFETSATVTIVPLTRPITATLTAHLVTGPADLAHQQIQGRQFADLTLSQNKTVATTGSGTQPAQAAQGMITFYNALPAAQTIPAGTLIIGRDGTQVTTDTTITIPAGQFASNGQTQVSAHVTEPGPAGNILSLDIDGPCCRTDVLAQDAAPFTGGQNARTYQAVSPQDITGASDTLQATLLQDATAAYQAELANGESLITPVACTSQIIADHPAGAEASHVTVTVTEDCQGVAYKTAQMRTLVLQALNNQNQAGAYQVSQLSLHIQITPSSTQKGNVQIQARALLVYHWSQQQLRALAALIAGKSETQARAVLLRQPGVSRVLINASGRETGTLPDDPGRIQIAVISAHSGY